MYTMLIKLSFKIKTWSYIDLNDTLNVIEKRKKFDKIDNIRDIVCRWNVRWKIRRIILKENVIT